MCSLRPLLDLTEALKSAKSDQISSVIARASYAASQCQKGSERNLGIVLTYLIKSSNSCVTETLALAVGRKHASLSDMQRKTPALPLIVSAIDCCGGGLPQQTPDAFAKHA
jgi:hypothetical protein